jgi:hypothetical protein
VKSNELSLAKAKEKATLTSCLKQRTWGGEEIRWNTECFLNGRQKTEHGTFYFIFYTLLQLLIRFSASNSIYPIFRSDNTGGTVTDMDHAGPRGGTRHDMPQATQG